MYSSRSPGNTKIPGPLSKSITPYIKKMGSCKDPPARKVILI